MKSRAAKVRKEIAVKVPAMAAPEVPRGTADMFTLGSRLKEDRSACGGGEPTSTDNRHFIYMS